MAMRRDSSEFRGEGYGEMRDLRGKRRFPRSLRRRMLHRSKGHGAEMRNPEIIPLIRRFVFFCFSAFPIFARVMIPTGAHGRELPISGWARQAASDAVAVGHCRKRSVFPIGAPPPKARGAANKKIRPVSTINVFVL